MEGTNEVFVYRAARFHYLALLEEQQARQLRDEIAQEGKRDPDLEILAEAYELNAAHFRRLAVHYLALAEAYPQATADQLL